MRLYNIAIIGATGAVGEEIINILEEERFPVASILPLASANSLGKAVEISGKEVPVLATSDEVFAQHKIDIAFFSAGGSVSERFAGVAANSGALVIDNTSFFRMCDDVPLVVPEVNPSDITHAPRNIIANPNCSTIQMVQVLAPLHKAFGIERIDVSTYQAASGAGKRGMEELIVQMQKFFSFELESCVPEVFAHRLALNAIPHIDVFLDNDYTKEEMKMIKETHKIMHADFPISATCVRVPVLRSHSESITIRFAQKVDVKQTREILESAPNIVVLDDPSAHSYPMPSIATDTNHTYVGRIRKDNFDDTILHLWCVADQIRVGAATNAVRIAQKWIELTQKS